MPSLRFPPRPVVVVDPDARDLRRCRAALRVGGITNVVYCGDGRRAGLLLARLRPSLLLIDASLPEMSDQTLLKTVGFRFPELPVIVTTGHRRLEDAVRCIEAGATDYAVKPVESQRLLSSIRRVLRFQELREENLRLKVRLSSGELEAPQAFSAITSNNARMRSLFLYIEAIARSTTPVLIIGETGVGKELLARALHRASGRDGMFVPVNPMGLDHYGFLDTLFGHRPGAFPGATRRRRGLAALARSGTLFFEEIACLEPASQTAVVRLVDRRAYLPLGGGRPRRTDARIVAASTREVDALQGEGGVRPDLLARFCTHLIRVPALRERLDDLPLLVELLLAEAARSLGTPKPEVPRELYEMLAPYHFPGNTGELRFMIFEALSRQRSNSLSLSTFRRRIEKAAATGVVVTRPLEQRNAGAFASWRRLPTLGCATADLVGEAMRRADGNREFAAELLGISAESLAERLERTQHDVPSADW